jgi:MEDS: MEthanogen/methylotroph, DcmR Sensory domain
MRDGSTSGGTLRPACSHLIHFYDRAYPAEAVSDFIAAGLAAGDACVVLLTAPHRHAVEQRLHACGMRTDANGSDPGTYRAIDTDEALSRMVVDGRLDMQRARDLLASVLCPPAHSGSRRVRAAGDPAPTLFSAGQRDDAVAFEGLVDSLAAAHGAAVFCAYPIADFCREGHTQSLFRFCAEHTALEFPERMWADGFLPRPRATSPDWPVAAGRTRS